MELERVDFPGESDIVPPSVRTADVAPGRVVDSDIPVARRDLQALCQVFGLCLCHRPDGGPLGQYPSRDGSSSLRTLGELSQHGFGSAAPVLDGLGEHLTT